MHDTNRSTAYHAHKHFCGADPHWPRPTAAADNHALTRCLAHTLWQSEGCPVGRALDHWLLAERLARAVYARVGPTLDGYEGCGFGQATGSLVRSVRALVTP